MRQPEHRERSADTRLLNAVAAASGLRDATNQPLIYTPHDFRRMFVTEARRRGLPAHIAARLLGHASFDTTQPYLAVFQDDLIRSYQAFLRDRRGGGRRRELPRRAQRAGRPER